MNQFIFLCYTLISVLLLEEFISLLNLGGFGISKFLFPLLISIYQIELKKYNKYKAIFISLLLSLLYHSTHTFIAVIISSITGDSFVTKYEALFFVVVLLLTYFVIKEIITYFHLELHYLTKITSIHFKKDYTWFLYFTYSIIHFRYGKYSCTF